MTGTNPRTLLLVALAFCDNLQIAGAAAGYDLDGVVESATHSARTVGGVAKWEERLDVTEERYLASTEYAKRSPEISCAVAATAAADEDRVRWRTSILREMLDDVEVRGHVLRACVAALLFSGSESLSLVECGGCGREYVEDADGERSDSGAPRFAPVCPACVRRSSARARGVRGIDAATHT